LVKRNQLKYKSFNPDENGRKFPVETGKKNDKLESRTTTTNGLLINSISLVGIRF